MTLIQEIKKEHSKILVVAKQNTLFLKMFVQALKASKIEVHTTQLMPSAFEEYDAYFFVQLPHILINEFADKPEKRFICILFNQDDMARTLSSFAYEHELNHIKIINLQTAQEFYHKDIETILWVAFARSEDIFLQIYHPEMHKSRPRVQQRTLNFRFSFPRKPRTLILLGILLIVLSNLLFIPPLLIGTYVTYQEAKTKLADHAYQPTRAINSWILISHSLYQYAAPTLHLFSLARPFEDLFQINNSAHHLLVTTTDLETNGNDLMELFITKNKTTTQTAELIKKKQAVFDDLRLLQGDMRILEEKLPKNKRLADVSEKLSYYNEVLPIILETEPYIDTFFAKETERKYVLFFANNMELRPGGGFIGSFAILKVSNYEIQDLKVYDVYDADGQLTEHLEPPKPISEYLAQPFWFLRDSAFTPDFISNMEEAETLLDKEIHESDFDGGMLFTTTAVQNILEATDSLYIPDFNETITKDNFYLKAQLYAEKDFFPGSIQKKRFLSSVMNQMLLNLGSVSLPDLVMQLQKSMNEKQMVMYSRDKKLQAFLEKNYWSGRTLKPKCNLPQAINCILDYAFPVDANLGVNKANFFIDRPTQLLVSIDDTGKITNTMTLEYKNNSYENIFPGGPYKNYFQLMMPPNTNVEEITIDGTKLEEYDESNFEFRTVGFLMEVPPQATKTVTVRYTIPTTIIKGNGMYQLIFQKQIGSANENLELTFDLPHNISMVNNNFSPLVKDNKIIYNTSISSDKIFLIEFSKK